ncbi:hypothetical protein D3C87_970810 [compost metagenome]
MCVGRFGRSDDFLIRGVVSAHGNIVLYRTRKEEGLLTNVGNMFAQVRKGNVAQIHSVDFD